MAWKHEKDLKSSLYIWLDVCCNPKLQHFSKFENKIFQILIINLKLISTIIIKHIFSAYILRAGYFVLNKYFVSNFINLVNLK